MRSTTSARRSSGEHHGAHRRAARRQLVDDRDVEVGVGRHRQRARDRRRRHDELVRHLRAAPALLRAAAAAAARRSGAARRRSTSARSLELHALLEQRMRADDDAAPRRWPPPRARCGACAPAASPDSSATVTPSGRNQASSVRQCCSASSSVGAISAACRPLPTRARGGGRGDHGLAAADVALHQPHHRQLAREVARRLRRARAAARR